MYTTPKVYELDCGLVIWEANSKQTRETDNIVKEFLLEQFNGVTSRVKVNEELIKCRLGMFSVKVMMRSLERRLVPS